MYIELMMWYIYQKLLLEIFQNLFINFKKKEDLNSTRAHTPLVKQSIVKHPFFTVFYKMCYFSQKKHCKYKKWSLPKKYICKQLNCTCACGCEMNCDVYSRKTFIFIFDVACYIHAIEVLSERGCKNTISHTEFQ